MDKGAASVGWHPLRILHVRLSESFWKGGAWDTFVPAPHSGDRPATPQAIRARRRRMTHIRIATLTRALLLFLCLFPAAALAQDETLQPSPSPMREPPRQAWTWSADGNVFGGYNYQQRHFADFSSWE